MKNSFRTLLAAVALTGAAACAEEDASLPLVKIVPMIETRVTGLHFDSGDRIGLTIVRETGTYVDNRAMTYDGTAFKADGLLWYNDMNEKSTLTAYYPYAEEGAPTLFTVATDQRAGCTSSDLLAAVRKEVTPAAAPVSMRFRHLMAQLTIRVENKSQATVKSVAIGGSVPTAEVDLTVPSVAVKSDAAASTVTAFEATAGAVYRAGLVPQEAALTVSVTMSDGKERSRAIPTTLLESGRRYDLAIEVSDIDISVGISGDIEDWEDGGSIGGGAADDAGSLEYEGETYRTTTIAGREWMAENLRYMPAGATKQEGVWDPAVGSSDTETLGLLYDYATAVGDAGAVAEGPVQGICPAGWHIPDRDELASLAGAESGFLTPAGYWIVNVSGGRYGSADRGYLMGATVEDGKYSCWSYGEGMAASLSTLNVTYGVSVRCVRDTTR